MGAASEPKPLTDYDVRILERILRDSIGEITYRNPERELGDLAEDSDATLAALRSLETEGVVTLKPLKKFGVFDRSVYEVNLRKVRELYSARVKR